MVYCGKPSRGCQMCRTRRIKCDETKPTCNQCAKSRRQCPGYKDEFDLVFRNETKATERRAQKANRKAIAKIGKEQQQTFPGARSLVERVVIPSSLNVPVEAQASCYFVSNFILIPRGARTYGFLDFVIPLLKQDGAQGHLRHAFDACSMAFLNNRGGSGGRLTERALYEYTQALNGTNAALRDIEAQKKDSTLAAVLLLGLFESITAKQIGSLNWGSHTWGAIQLVKARGRKQLKTQTGLQLFIAVRTQMIIHSLTTGTAPTMGSEWWITDAVSDPTAAQALRILIKTGELRAEVTRLMSSLPRTPDNIEVMLDMIRQAQAVDRDAVSWMESVPAPWRYRTVAWEDSVPRAGSSGGVAGDYARAEVFPGRVDAYRDFWTASVWNLSRTARLILASLVVRCAAWVCAPVDYRTTPEYATAARTCADVIADVVASVPYHLGWRRRRRHCRRSPGQQQQQQDVLLRDENENENENDYEEGENEGDDEGGEDSTKGLAGYFLTWPLTCVNSLDFTTDAQRAWIHGRLRYIGNDLGVKYAHILRQLSIRIPSMMIRRDGLMASPWGANHNFEKYVSAKLDPGSLPSASSAAYAAVGSSAGADAGAGAGPREGQDQGQAQAQAQSPQKRQQQIQQLQQIQMQMLKEAMQKQQQDTAAAASSYLGPQPQRQQNYNDRAEFVARMAAGSGYGYGSGNQNGSPTSTGDGGSGGAATATAIPPQWISQSQPPI